MGEFAHPRPDATHASLEPRDEARTFGRYVLYAPIARGGMATIHIARLVGDDGFSRIVAAKRLHPQFTEDPDFVAMFRDEAEIASKIHHPNVVPVLDIVLDGEEVVLVQEYVHGVPLDRLFRAACASRDGIPVRVAVAIASGILSGLHAAHETTDETGQPLGVIHRDVSPQNVMVSVDGIPRLLDFGIAKASSSAHVTREGLLKGKLAYMAPEQVRGDDATRATDVYACGVVLWELLAMRRLHAGRTDAQILAAVLHEEAPRLDVVERLASVVAKATASAPGDRYATAADMFSALVRAAPAASALEVAAWAKARGAEYLERRQQVLASNEESWRSLSKVMAASPGGPQSGVTRVRGSARVVTPSGPPSSRSEAAMLVGDPADAPFAADEERPRARRLPWVVAAVSVAMSGALLGALEARQAAPPLPETPAPPEVVSTVAPSPPPVEAPAPSAGATSFLAMAPSAASSAPAASPAPALRSVRAAVAPRRVDAPPTVVHAAAAPQVPSAKADCDPPFYFEGTKKVFKPSCI